MIDQALYGFEEGVQVGVDGGPNDSVSGVEVSVCEVVAHPGDLTPGDAWFGCEQLLGKGLDCFTDLEKSDSHGIEDQPIREVAAIDVRTNGFDRSDDI